MEKPNRDPRFFDVLLLFIIGGLLLSLLATKPSHAQELLPYQITNTIAGDAVCQLTYPYFYQFYALFEVPQGGVFPVGSANWNRLSATAKSILDSVPIPYGELCDYIKTKTCPACTTDCYLRLQPEAYYFHLGRVTIDYFKAYWIQRDCYNVCPRYQDVAGVSCNVRLLITLTTQPLTRELKKGDPSGDNQQGPINSPLSQP